MKSDIKFRDILRFSNEQHRAYREGQEACRRVGGDPSKAQNPYQAKTEAWYSWNQGWNSR